MSKWIIIILLISALSGWVIWYYNKIGVKSISKQLDLKAWNTNIDWIISTRQYCDWICKNYTSNNSSSNSWGWWSWWGK